MSRSDVGLSPSGASGETPRQEAPPVRDTRQSDIHPTVGTLDVWIPPPTSLPGQPPRIAGFDIEGELGRGGMGVVYKARHQKLERVCALKLIANAVLAGPRERERFRGEARLAAGLNHPNIVQVYEVGEQDGLPYLALEYVEGSSLDRIIAGKPQQAVPSAALVATLARAVHYAHQHKVIHRDLKPGNVLLALPPHPPTPSPTKGERGSKSAPAPPSALKVGEGGGGGEGAVPKIADFGLAKKLDAPQGQPTGKPVGTPPYMAPEQVLDHEKGVGMHTDVYALGAILYELLTGRPPFLAATDYDILMLVVSADPLPPSQLGLAVPRDLEVICLKCLHKEPAKRYRSASDLADDLTRFLEGRPILARPTTALERAWKSMQRHPLVWALSLGLVLLAVASFALVSWEWLAAAENARVAQERAAGEERAKVKALAAQRDAAEQAERALAQEQKVRLAKEQAERLNGTLSRNLYTRQVAAAEREWLANDVGRARGLLAACPAVLRNWEWHYVSRLCQADQLTLSHPGKVLRVSFTSDGARLFCRTDAGDEGGEVHVWDWQADPPQKLRVRTPAEARQAVPSPDGKFLALPVEMAGEVRLWSVEAGKVERSWRLPRASTATFSRDGKYVAAAGEVNEGTEGKSRAEVRVWETHTGKEVCSLSGPSSVYSLAFSPDGLRLAFGGGSLSEGEVQVWELAPRKQVVTFTSHSSQVFSVAFSPDGKRVASGSYDRTVKVWDAQTGQEQLTLGGHTNAVLSVAFSPDGSRLASGSWDQSIKVWSARNGVEEFTLRGHAREVSSIAFSPDGRYLASGSWDHTVKLWEVHDSNPAVTLRAGHSLCINSLAYHPRGRRLATAGRIGDTVMLWQPGMGAPAGSFSGKECVAFSPDGKLLASALEEKEKHVVKVWDVEDNREVRVLRGHEGEVQALAFSPDGKLIVTGARDSTVRLWEAATGKQERVLSEHNPVSCVAFFPDGRIAAGGYDKAVRIWDSAGRPLHILAHPFAVRGLAVSRDGKRLAVATGAFNVPGEVWVWDAGSGKKLHSLRGHADQVNAVAFNPDGTRLASASHDKSVKLWDPASGEEVFSLRPYASAVTAVAFSPDGLRLATGSWDGEVKVWDASPRAGGKERTADSGARQLVDWLEANSAAGRRSSRVRSLSEVLVESREGGNGVWVRFGSAMLKSGKATEVVLFADQLFSFELSQEQARQVDLGPRSVHLSTSRRHERREEPALAELSGLRIDNAAHLDGTKKITGEVSCRALRPARGQLALRLSTRTGAHFFYLEKGLPEGTGAPLRFTFSALHDPDAEDKGPAGPLPVFLDLCTVIDRPGQLPDVVLHSNTVGVQVQVATEKKGS